MDKTGLTVLMTTSYLLTDRIIMICNDCDLNLCKRFEVDTNEEWTRPG